MRWPAIPSLGSVARYQSQSEQVALQLEELAEKQENLRATMVAAGPITAWRIAHPPCHSSSPRLTSGTRRTTDMLARATHEAYRQSNFDVRLMASDRDDLVLICLDDLIENLGVLEIVEQRDDRAARSRTLTRCVTALTALEMGIDREAELASSLAHFYGAAKNLMLDSIRALDLGKVRQLRDDLREIAFAFRAAKLAASGH